MSMTESDALEILTRDDEEMRKGFFCINDFFAIEVAKKALEEIQQYRAIGTVSEFRELKEKATAKKVIQHRIDDLTFYICPTCGKANANSRLKTEPKYCKGCGQHLDWSEEKE